MRNRQRLSVSLLMAGTVFRMVKPTAVMTLHIILGPFTIFRLCFLVFLLPGPSLLVKHGSSYLRRVQRVRILRY